MVVLRSRTRLLPITAIIRPPVPLPPVIVTVAVVVYPWPGSFTTTCVITPALLITAVMVAGTVQSPVTVSSGATVYPLPPSAIIEPKFFNCFAFGNGAESYKILDSIVGKTFNLGNRVTTTSAFNYKESDRFADITYSGVYNSESNTNKLNS